MTRKHILVVDDSYAIRELVRTVLQLGGYDVTLAADGHEALTILECCTPDLVLTDLHMPSLNGIALVQHINVTWSTLPVILWTTDDMLHAEELTRQCRADAFLTKSVDLEMLLACIAGLLA